jgi:hypothetical protein
VAPLAFGLVVVANAVGTLGGETAAPVAVPTLVGGLAAVAVGVGTAGGWVVDDAGGSGTDGATLAWLVAFGALGLVCGVVAAG